MEDDEIIRAFLIESNENLNCLDAEIVDLERHPTPDRVASIFRTIHTIKGTCGFLGFPVLENLSHLAESILSQLREGERGVDSEIVSLILQSVDAIRKVLNSIDGTGKEGDCTFPELIQRLEHAAAQVSVQPGDCSPDDDLGKNAAMDEPPLSAAAESFIRVDVKLLDKLMNLIGELVLVRNQLLQGAAGPCDAALNKHSQHLNMLTTELQDSLMRARMQPIRVIWNHLPRLVRDVAHSLGKLIDLEMEGANTELDRTIIEAIKDPLTHIVRNACDHGVEEPSARVRKGKTAKGTLRLKAYHAGGKVYIEISDDGAGVDLERVKQRAVERRLIRAEQASALSERDAIALLFLPGFSTAPAITSLSGRGVGMDVVKSNVEKIGGAVEILTKPGEGSTVRLEIPLTLAIVPGLIVTSAGHKFVIPQASLVELIHVEADAVSKIEFVHETPVYRRGGALLPVIYLNQLLSLPTPRNEIESLIVLHAIGREFALVVDGVIDTEEIVVKPLSSQLKGLSCYSGATILGDGEVALILDVAGIGRLGSIFGQSGGNPQREESPTQQPERAKQSLLVFRSGAMERLALPISVVTRLEEIPRASVEVSAGRRVVQHRGVILPLIDCSASIEQTVEPGSLRRASEDVGTAPLQVIVFSLGCRSLGLVIDEIVDIVEEMPPMHRSASARAGILGSAVVGGKVTDFLDLEAVMELSGDGLLAASAPQGGGSLLLVDPSAFHRGLLRSQLEMSGHDVVECSAVPQALEILARSGETLRLLIVAGDLLAANPDEAERLKKEAGDIHLPILALGRSPGEVSALQDSGVILFDRCQSRFERKTMLQSIENLSRVLTHRAHEQVSAK